MTVNNEGNAPAPGSLEAEALAELEKEGHTVERSESDEEPESKKDEPADDTEDDEEDKEDKQDDDESEDEDDNTAEERKSARTPRMVEAYKLKISEDQKDKAEKRAAELEAENARLKAQTSPDNSSQNVDLEKELEAIAEESGLPVEVLKKISDVALKKAGISPEDRKIIDEFKEKNAKLEEDAKLNQELQEFNTEFDKEVAPQLKKYNLSDETLSQIKEDLKGYAFSEKYAKLPLSELFQLKQSELSLKEPRKSSESRNVKGRADKVVDIDSIDEKTFDSLSDEQIEEFVSKKSGSNWQTRR